MKKIHENILQGYELRRVIGDGSNGMVYLAVDTHDGQEVAVKEFPLGEESAQRFFREMSFLFTLNHPNIIRCLNLIYGKSNKSYLILEYAPNGNLRNVIRRQASGMDSSVVLAIARQMGAALCAAHAKEIIHCDVKPENVLLCGADLATAVYKLTDLGIATHRKLEAQQLSSGSPLYMAPEQFYDQPEPASDMYSLGILLFECLTGSVPFAADDPQRLFVAHQHATPDFEKVHCPRWRHALSRLLLKQPSERPCAEADLHALWDYVEYGHEQPVVQLEKPRARKRSLPQNPRLFTSPPVRNHTFLVPTAEKLCCPDPEAQGELWIADSRGLDRVIYPHRKLSRQFWQGHLTAADYDKQSGVLWCVLSGQLQRWDTVAQRFLRCGPMEAGHRSFCVWGEDRLIAADSATLSCLDTSGRIHWSIPCGNYALDPCLLPVDEGHCMVSRGPSKPSVQLFDLQGRVVRSSPVPGPVLALAHVTEKKGQVLAVVQGMTSDAPCLMLEADMDLRWTDRATLPSGIYRAHSHGDFITLHDLDGTVYFCGSDGLIWAKHECDQLVLDDCWLPCSSLYFMLLQSASGKPAILESYVLKYQIPTEHAALPHDAVAHMENN